MWRITARYLRETLKSNKVAVFVVVAGGMLAGSIATVKSVIESSLISVIADAVRQHTVADLLEGPLIRVGATSTGDRVADLTIGLLPQLSVAEAFPTYIAVSLLGASIAVLTGLCREMLTRGLFSSLYRAGIDSAFDREDTPSATKEHGGLAVSVQQGAGAVSSSYALVIETAQYFFALMTVLLVLVRASVLFALSCLGVTLLLAAISLIQAKHLRARRETYDTERRKLLTQTDDTIINRDVLLAHERRESSVASLRAASYRLADIGRRLSVQERMYDGTVTLVEDLGRISILIVVIVAAATRADLEQVGDTYFFVSIFVRLMAPIRGIFSGYDDVRRSTSTSRTLLDLLAQTPPAPATTPDDQAVQPGGQHPNHQPADVAAELRDVSHTYESEDATTPPALEHCSFRVPLGGVTLVVGRSGAGKTTIARILLGFLTPTEGEAHVFGRSTSTTPHSELLAKMSYLSQVGHVVNGSVEENLFAAADRDRVALRQALRDAGLAASAAEADQLLRRDAHDLSEGQKQRLALARILVDDAPLVILDEPLAGVDAFTFSEVRAHLHAWLRNPDRTVVLVTHRLAFASAATHVIVLGERGHVLEEGTPYELAGRPNGLFAALLATARAELEPDPVAT